MAEWSVRLTADHVVRQLLFLRSHLNKPIKKIVTFSRMLANMFTLQGKHAITRFLQTSTSVSTILACMMPIVARTPLEVMSATVHQTTRESIAK